MMAWPVSWFVLTVKVGSSSESLAKEIPIFSWSALVFGSIASEMTGSGKVILSRMTGFASSHRVSPVKVSLSPTAAPISPAPISLISSL